ncbi:conserved hypothetical protein [Bosea sp. 62]|uniref:hypothetical protein n=1 Tax=unclassified Bosea (in: a-proteobacteria) TaxID=2653178 RepID=UPI0012585405|nr:MULTISPECIES: hypothetical protein [unclassified Bosea (in: a-proteobacteria)]CAD5246318.1 conserved hypothetical protein [Bosea sp. 46]CAD5248248.1 conserved hypothetical protein [Bosea sp. 21B]CAD5267719.1 conserved hypothetical protein [Bosea sp. 7B]VVT45527.1 conserved hypothetical protein [Bosea sp. EC-HK365B]VXA94053.1 conserved hypothetical protein [Bosea sp. 29B]
MLQFERRHERLVPIRRFALRLGRAILLWLALTVVGLAIGMIGYAASEGMSGIDAFVNAAMILSGMGPVAELKTDAGKLFAGLYAIFSGLFVVIATGFVLAPILHRVLHSFHIEEGKANDD